MLLLTTAYTIQVIHKEVEGDRNEEENKNAEGVATKDAEHCREGPAGRAVSAKESCEEKEKNTPQAQA
jgi:hypothetical protein